MKPIKLIKKYNNRKLYDTDLSEYITSKDIIKLTHEETPFLVIDAATHEDITQETMLSAITRKFNKNLDVFSKHNLTLFIRCLSKE